MSLNGDYLKDLRIKKGISQEKLGLLIGKTQSEISKYESGLLDIPIELYPIISQKLNGSEYTFFKNLQDDNFRFSFTPILTDENIKKIETISILWNKYLTDKEIEISRNVFNICKVIRNITQAAVDYKIVGDFQKFGYKLLYATEKSLRKEPIDFPMDILLAIKRIAVNTSNIELYEDVSSCINLFCKYIYYGYCPENAVLPVDVRGWEGAGLTVNFMKRDEYLRKYWETCSYSAMMNNVEEMKRLKLTDEEFHYFSKIHEEDLIEISKENIKELLPFSSCIINKHNKSAFQLLIYCLYSKEEYDFSSFEKFLKFLIDLNDFSYVMKRCYDLSHSLHPFEMNKFIKNLEKQVSKMSMKNNFVFNDKDYEELKRLFANIKSHELNN